MVRYILEHIIDDAALCCHRGRHGQAAGAVEQGAHDQLMAQKDFYYKLYANQLG